MVRIVIQGTRRLDISPAERLSKSFNFAVTSCSTLNPPRSRSGHSLKAQLTAPIFASIHLKLGDSFSSSLPRKPPSPASIMKAATRFPVRLAPRLIHPPVFVRSIHSTVPKPANVAPIVGTGPPPEPPAPASTSANLHERLARRRRQAELLKNAKDLRNAKSGKTSGGMRQRFWKEVTVQEVNGELQLDTRWNWN